jgi:hypothetical protein
MIAQASLAEAERVLGHTVQFNMSLLAEAGEEDAPVERSASSLSGLAGETVSRCGYCGMRGGRGVSHACCL